MIVKYVRFLKNLILDKPTYKISKILKQKSYLTSLTYLLTRNFYVGLMYLSKNYVV